MECTSSALELPQTLETGCGGGAPSRESWHAKIRRTGMAVGQPKQRMSTTLRAGLSSWLGSTGVDSCSPCDLREAVLAFHLCKLYRILSQKQIPKLGPERPCGTRGTCPPLQRGELGQAHPLSAPGKPLSRSDEKPTQWSKGRGRGHRKSAPEGDTCWGLACFLGVSDARPRVGATRSLRWVSLSLLGLPASSLCSSPGVGILLILRAPCPFKYTAIAQTSHVGSPAYQPRSHREQRFSCFPLAPAYSLTWMVN